MRSVGDVFNGEQRRPLMDAQTQATWSLVPDEVVRNMREWHGSLAEVYGCRECWLVAKDIYNARMAMLERGKA